MYTLDLIIIIIIILGINSLQYIFMPVKNVQPQLIYLSPFALLTVHNTFLGYGLIIISTTIFDEQ